MTDVTPVISSCDLRHVLPKPSAEVLNAEGGHPCGARGDVIGITDLVTCHE
jgi:hypothetical protein